MSSNYQLGKVFISHSSVDKPFVRKLSQSIQNAGFQVWLDEKELLVGDSLPSKISEAVKSAAVVLVVVSRAAVQSRWLAFELNQATQKMIEGKCRVIPVVFEQVELPSEVTGLLYADFTGNKESALSSIITALKYEARSRAVNRAFWSRAEQLLSDAFGSIGSVSTLSDGYHSADFSAIFLPPRNSSSEDITIPYETVADYTSKQDPLTEIWVTEYGEELDRFGASLALVVTERPLGFKSDRTYTKNNRVHAVSNGTSARLYSHVVYVDLSQLEDYEKELAIVKDSKSFLESLADELFAEQA